MTTKNVWKEVRLRREEISEGGQSARGAGQRVPENHDVVVHNDRCLHTAHRQFEVPALIAQGNFDKVDVSSLFSGRETAKSRVKSIY